MTRQLLQRAAVLHNIIWKILELNRIRLVFLPQSGPLPPYNAAAAQEFRWRSSCAVASRLKVEVDNFEARLGRIIADREAELGAHRQHRGVLGEHLTVNRGDALALRILDHPTHQQPAEAVAL